VVLSLLIKAIRTASEDFSHSAMLKKKENSPWAQKTNPRLIKPYWMNEHPWRDPTNNAVCTPAKKYEEDSQKDGTGNIPMEDGDVATPSP